MKKVLLLCISVVFMTSLSYSQLLNLNEKPVQKSTIQKDLIQKANQTWDVQFTDTIESLCIQPTGAVSDGTYLYAGSLSKTMIFKIDSLHKVIDTITITGVPKETQINVKLFGLAYDNPYFYATNGNDSIYKIDLSSKSVIDIITLPIGTIPMGLTFSPDADGGNGGFWVSGFQSHNVLKLFSRTGTLLDSITELDTNYYYGDNFLCGLAYDNVSVGGPFLYGLEFKSATQQFIICINLSSKGVNSQVHYVSQDMPDWEPLNAFGIYIQPNVIPGTNTLGVVYNSLQHIGYNLDKLVLPQGLSIVNSFTKPWLKVGETGIVSANVYCSGKAPILSYDFHYKLDGVTFSKSITGANITNGYYNPSMLIHESTIATLSEGTHDLDIWFANINGNASINSDTLSMHIDVYPKVTQRIVLHEVFTSSTCNPCRPSNMLLDSTFAKNPGKYTCVKYQMNWPSPGDPYFTLEGGVRRDYYGVEGIPDLAADGDYYNGSLGAYTSSMLMMEYIQASFIDFEATFITDGDHLYTTTLKVSPLKTITGNNKLYVALVEKVTHMNMKTNGESSFYYVHKKFMTDVSGQSITLTEDQDVVVDLEYKFIGKYRLPFNAGGPINHDVEHSVENFNNMMLVYWVQNYDTKNVLQSGQVDAPVLSIEDYRNNNMDVKVYPNPSDGKINVYSEKLFTNVKLVNMLGQVVYTMPVTTNEYSFQISNLQPGIYVLQLQTEKGPISRKINIK